MTSLINILQSLSDNEIKFHHRNISDKTFINFGFENPSLCGTVSNAILHKCLRHNFTSINNIKLMMILITFDNNSTKKVYQVAFGPKDIYLDSNPVFGGHAFTIIKISRNKYYVLQSYQYHYELRECHLHARIEYTKKELLTILDDIKGIVYDKYVSNKTCASWESFTGVKINYLKKYRLHLTTDINMGYISTKYIDIKSKL